MYILNAKPPKILWKWKMSRVSCTCTHTILHLDYKRCTLFISKYIRISFFYAGCLYILSMTMHCCVYVEHTSFFFVCSFSFSTWRFVIRLVFYSRKPSATQSNTHRSLLHVQEYLMLWWCLCSMHVWVFAPNFKRYASFRIVKCWVRSKSCVNYDISNAQQIVKTVAIKQQSTHKIYALFSSRGS